MKRLSIIVPVFNVEIHKLNRMLKSIVKQNLNYDDYEVIIVDDGSYDNIIDKIEQNFFMEIDLKIYIEKHLGVSQARNVGIKHSLGNYVAFVDADDELADGYLKMALEFMSKYQLDIVIGGIALTNECFEYYEEHLIDSSKQLTIYNSPDALLSMILIDKPLKENSELKKCLIGSPCGCVYRKSVMQSIKFNTNVFRIEDRLFNINVLFQSNRIGVVRSIWYHYIQYNDSSLHRKQPSLLDNNQSIVDEVTKLNIEMSNNINRRLCDFSCYQFIEGCAYEISGKPIRARKKFIYTFFMDIIKNQQQVNKIVSYGVPVRIYSKVFFYAIKNKNVKYMYISICIFRIISRVKKVKMLLLQMFNSLF